MFSRIQLTTSGVLCCCLSLVATMNCFGANPHRIQENKNSSNESKTSRFGEATSEPDESSFLQGIVQPKRDAVLRFQTPGTVASIHVQEGDRVSPGQPLITLDDRVAKASVNVARAAATARALLQSAELSKNQAKLILERTELAVHKNAAAEFEVQAKRLQYEQAVAAVQAEREQLQRAQAELELAEASCNELTLYAPFAGEVVLIGVKLGNSVDPTQVAIRVADLDELQIELHLPINYFGRVNAGDSILLHASHPVGRDIQANAHYVSPIVEPTSSTFRALLQLDNHNRLIPAGTEVWFRPELNQ